MVCNALNTFYYYIVVLNKFYETNMQFSFSPHTIIWSNNVKIEEKSVIGFPVKNHKQPISKFVQFAFYTVTLSWP